jgi:hypothetical protein
LTEAEFRSRLAQLEQQIHDKYNVASSEIALALATGRLAECELVNDWLALRAFEWMFRDGHRGGFGAPRGDGISDSVYEAIGMLLRGLVYHEHSGGRTPEHLAGQACRTIAILSPAIAAEIEQDGAARVYEERWDVPERSAASAIAEDVRLGRSSQQIRDEIIGKVGMMAYSRTPEMQARYDAAVEREQIAVHGPAGAWLFAQNSIAPSTCGHSQIALSNDEVPTLSCQSCGKRWTFVPEGEMPRYCEVDDPKFPGMLDNRGWPNDARVEIEIRRRKGAP